MNYPTKKFTLLFLSLQSLIIVGAQPSAAGAGADAQKKEMHQLRNENALLMQNIAAAIATLENPNSRLVESSGVKAVAETLEPIEQLRELLKKFYDSNFATTNNLKLRNNSVASTMNHLKFKHARSADHKAFLDKNDAIVSFIEKHKTTIKDMRSAKGETALMLCTQYANKAAMDKLINEIGMDIFTVDNEGDSILKYCISPIFCPESVIYFARKLQKTHQHLIEDALSYVPLAEIVDVMWPFLTHESKVRFVNCCDWNHKAYKNIKHEFPALKKQSQDQKSIAQMGAEVAREFAPGAALTPEQIAKLETHKAAQQRRKENKRKKAEEEKAQQALALQKRDEQEKLEAALEEKRKKEKEHEAELNAKADAFIKTHEPAHNTQAVHHAFEYWKAQYAAQKQQERDNQKLANEHWQTLKNKHEKKYALSAINKWQKLVANQKELHKTADMFAARKALLAWRAAQQQAHEELNLRLIACANAFDMYQHIKNKEKKYYSSKDNKELEEKAMALELGRAQINLLLSGQRIVHFYAQRGHTSESFSRSKKPHDTAAQKLLFEIEKHLGSAYSFGPNSPMIAQFFKNSLDRKETHEQEQAHKLFDVVRARDTKRITALLRPSLRNSEHAHLNTFRHWLGTQLAELPADAMINGEGMRDILSIVYINLKGKPSVKSSKTK